MNTLSRVSRRLIGIGAILIALTMILGGLTPAFAGFNADSPEGARRIFTQLALAGKERGRLVSYHVLEPGPPPGVQSGPSFPTDRGTGMIVRFPRCPGLRPVLDDTAAPSSATEIVPDRAARALFDATYANCTVQPKSVDEVKAAGSQLKRKGFVNAPSVPAPVGAAVPTKQQQSPDSLWGPVPNVPATLPPGVDPARAFPQPVQGTTESGIAVGLVEQPEVRRPRIQGFAAGREVWFITYETSGGLASPAVEAQWRDTRFPGDADLVFLAYGRAPLPASITNTRPDTDTEQSPAVVNVVGGAPSTVSARLTHDPDGYSPIWKMLCFDGGFRPLIGPGTEKAPCGSTRFSQIGQPRFPAGIPHIPDTDVINGVFEAINCPIIAVDFDDDGRFAPDELMVFPDLDWDFDGVPDGTVE